MICMKKVVLLVGASFLFIACGKTLGTNDPESYTIKVMEHKTNTPLSGVTVSLYRCTNYDLVFGCQGKAKFATYTTNSKGEAVIPDNDYNKANEGIVLSRSQYWEIQGGQGDNYMLPEALARLTLKTSKNYPDTTMLDIMTEGDFGIKNVLTIKAPKDSIADFRMIGNASNTIRWIAYPKMPPCIFYCPRDTLAAGNIMLSAQKFETVSSTINY